MAKFTTYQDYMATLPQHRQQAIKEETELLIQSYELSQLRQSLNINQNELAEKMGVSQANISKVENGNDCLLSTLKKYVRALGGEINITAKMPNGDVVIC